MPSSYSISSHEAQSVVQLEAKVTVQVSCGHSTQAGWERHRETVVFVNDHMGENDVAQTPSGPQTSWSHSKAEAGKKLSMLGVWKGPLYYRMQR